MRCFACDGRLRAVETREREDGGLMRIRRCDVCGVRAMTAEQIAQRLAPTKKGPSVRLMPIRKPRRLECRLAPTGESDATGGDIFS